MLKVANHNREAKALLVGLVSDHIIAPTGSVEEAWAVVVEAVERHRSPRMRAERNFCLTNFS